MFNLLFVILLLDIFGIFATVYLIQKRRQNQKPICPVGDDCYTVLSSKYNRLFFVHNDQMGLLFYIAAAAFSVALMNSYGPTEIILWLFGLMLGVASVLSAFFIYLQWKVLEAWCFWCVVSAANVWVISALFVYQYFFL